MGFRLTDDSTAAQNHVITEVRAYLTAQTGTDPITALPMVRARGQWPGQPTFTRIMVLLYIITALAFLSVRRVFSAEAVVLAFVGWAFGVLLGWLIYEGLLALLLRNATLSLPQEFPPSIPLVTLAGVLVLTLLVIRGPLRRATRIQPAAALRYQ